MLLLDLFKGFETDLSYLIYVLWFSRNQFDGHNLVQSPFPSTLLLPS